MKKIFSLFQSASIPPVAHSNAPSSSSQNITVQNTPASAQERVEMAQDAVRLISDFGKDYYKTLIKNLQWGTRLISWSFISSSLEEGKYEPPAPATLCRQVIARTLVNGTPLSDLEKEIQALPIPDKEKEAIKVWAYQTLLMRTLAALPGNMTVALRQAFANLNQETKDQILQNVLDLVPRPTAIRRAADFDLKTKRIDKSLHAQLENRLNDFMYRLGQVFPILYPEELKQLSNISFTSEKAQLFNKINNVNIILIYTSVYSSKAPAGRCLYLPICPYEERNLILTFLTPELCSQLVKPLYDFFGTEFTYEYNKVDSLQETVPLSESSILLASPEIFFEFMMQLGEKEDVFCYAVKALSFRRFRNPREVLQYVEYVKERNMALFTRIAQGLKALGYSILE